MLKNYVTIALRNLRRQKGYSSINIVGLAVGLTCSFFILLWVTDELSYDRFHAHGDRLYRVLRNVSFGDEKYTWETTPKPLAEVLEADYPEVEHVVLTSWAHRELLTHGTVSFREYGYYAGPAFFEVFTFPLVEGDPAKVIDQPNAIAISERLAAKLFGGGKAVGQTISVDRRKDFVVTGVFRDVPEHSSLRFDYILPIEDFIERNAWVENWGSGGTRSYVLLEPGASGAAVSRKIKRAILDHYEEAGATVFLQPFQDIRLYSEYRDWRLVGGRIEYVRLFSVVALFLLAIACINFMNLATARSMQRAREIGVRKVVGASRRLLVVQFMGEAMLIAGIAFVLALGAVAALLPLYNSVTHKTVRLGELDPLFLVYVLGVAAVTGVLSGSYPALYLSSLSPMSVLRGTLAQLPVTTLLRKGLVVFQFALSILLIVGTMGVYTQIQYIRTKNLGLDRENVLMLPFEGAVQERFDAYRQELLGRPGIAAVTTVGESPLEVWDSTTEPAWDEKAPEDNTLFHIISANYDLVETMRMELVAGRAHARAFATDTSNFVVNERAAAAMGMEDPVGKRLVFRGREGQIIGVVKDFHMASLYTEIQPTIIQLDPALTWQLVVRTEPGRTGEALASIEAVHKAFNPGYPLEYRFMDQSYEDTYRSEITMGKLANLFALVATFISCLGLFGLASFTTERRAKEIGIRKVLGASVPGLVMLLSMSFTKLVLVAFVLAAPVAYYAMDRWLGSFAYRVELGYGIFVLTGVVALAVAWLTVSYQSLRAALADPVRSMRTE